MRLFNLDQNSAQTNKLYFLCFSMNNNEKNEFACAFACQVSPNLPANLFHSKGICWSWLWLTDGLHSLCQRHSFVTEPFGFQRLGCVTADGVNDTSVARSQKTNTMNFNGENVKVHPFHAFYLCSVNQLGCTVAKEHRRDIHNALQGYILSRINAV